jgi:hypothetical protein
MQERKSNLMLPFRFGALMVILASCCAHAQYVGTLDHTKGRQLKLDNTLIISWILKSEDPDAKQVEIFDMLGHSLVEVNVLRLVPEARRVSIYDVSARPGGIIAVAAVYRSKEEGSLVRPAAALLLFGFDGRLLSAFALTSSRQISRLEVDDQSYIWTLADHLDDGDDPSTLPMVVEYTEAGAEARKVLTRAMFPLHVRRIEQSASIGVPSMGHDSDIFWFWLPGSTDLVTVSTRADDRPMVAKTGLPKSVGMAIRPYHLFRMPSGEVVGQFNEKAENGTSEWSYYAWSPSVGLWAQFKPAMCDGDQLIGVNAHQQVYLHHRAGSDRVDVCTFEAK